MALVCHFFRQTIIAGFDHAWSGGDASRAFSAVSQAFSNPEGPDALVLI
ncbi:MAG: hypothetical protein QM766_08145 [Burkholderiaceae bacterium]